MSRTPRKICENRKTVNNKNSVSGPAQLYSHEDGGKKIVGTWLQRNNSGDQKSLGPLKFSLEMVHKVICPQKKKYE
jgi:hypothetical protein